MTSPTTSEGRRRPASSRRRGRSCLPLLLMLVVLGVALALAWPRVAPLARDLIGGPEDYAAEDATGTTTTVVVPSGATGGGIATALEEADVVKSAQAFVEVANDDPRAARIQPGTYEIETRLPAAEALAALLDPATRRQISVTIPEGFTVTQVVERVASATETPAEEVRAVAEDPARIGLPAEAGGKAEGWFAAETYAFDPDDDVAAILSTMVDHTQTRLDDLQVPAEDRQAVLTKASIVEREVALPEYFGKVARVIDNRLQGGAETNGLLQMDSTVLYGVGKSGGIPSRAELENDNPYNTYKTPGLPPTPIGAPGVEAVRAVLDPPEGPWMYFTTVDLDTGETKFATTLEEQNKLIGELRAWRDSHDD